MAKIYNDGVKSHELEEKLKYMMNHQPNSSVLNQVAWPLDVIYDTNKLFTGFIMPMLNINAELGEIYTYPSQIDVSTHQKLLIARNICVVIAGVHKAGYVFGDFNPGNIGVDKDNCTVAFLDTDSYHIVDERQNIEYRCNVGCDGYIAPELLKSCDDFKSANPKEKEVYAKVKLPSFTKDINTIENKQILPIESILSSITASSVLAPQKDPNTGARIEYVPANVLDGRNDTAWVEGVEGDGIAEWIRLDFIKPIELTGLYIKNGYWKSERRLIQNHRLKRIRVELDDGYSQTFDLPDPADLPFDQLLQGQGDRLAFPSPLTTSYVKIVILETYRGTDGEEACISGIQLFQE